MIKCRIKRMQRPYRCSRLCKYPHLHTEKVLRNMLLFMQKTGGNISWRSHFHHFSTHVHLKIHHEKRTDHSSILIKTSQVPSLIWMYQLPRHIIKQCLRCFRRKCCLYISCKLLYFFRFYKTNLHLLFPP